MGLLLNRIQNREGRGRKFWIAFFMAYSVKIFVIIITIWAFLVVRQDIIDIYEKCEPFIIHAINITNQTMINISIAI